MSIKYKIIEQCEPGVSGGGNKKFYARACGRQRKGIRDICDLIAERSALSSGDIMSVLWNFTDIIPNLLLEGYTIDMDELGTMSLSIKSKGEDSAEEVSFRSITGVKINFRPSVKMKNQVTNASYIKEK